MTEFLKEYGTCTGPLGFPMQDDDARELEKLLESHTKDSALQYQHKAIETPAEIVIQKERTDVSVITDGSLDKDNEIVKPDGVGFKWYDKSRLVALNHNYRILPLGKCLWYKRRGDEWIAKTQYVNRPDNHPSNLEWVPDTIFHLVKEKFMRGNSIGFLPQKAHPPSRQDIEFNHEAKSAKIIWDQVEVFEYSKCAVSINHNALVEEVCKGVINLSEDVFGDEFSEVRDAACLWEEKQKSLREQEEQIKSLTYKYRTIAQIKAAKKYERQKRIKEMESRIPELVESTLDRLRGVV